MERLVKFIGRKLFSLRKYLHQIHESVRYLDQYAEYGIVTGTIQSEMLLAGKISTLIIIRKDYLLINIRSVEIMKSYEASKTILVHFALDFGYLFVPTCNFITYLTWFWCNLMLRDITSRKTNPIIIIWIYSKRRFNFIYHWCKKAEVILSDLHRNQYNRSFNFDTWVSIYQINEITIWNGCLLRFFQ